MSNLLVVVLTTMRHLSVCRCNEVDKTATSDGRNQRRSRTSFILLRWLQNVMQLVLN